MSHAATNWAFNQPEAFRDMKPAEWAVLMVLADCHNPIKGCFPSQQYICSKTNLTERAVRDHLVRLKGRGLINWDAGRENGKRGSNRYRLAFEADFQPAESAGRSTGKIEHEQPAEIDTDNRQILPPNPVREPLKEPEREGAGERENKFEQARRAWPTGFTDSRDDALAAWLVLSLDDQATAAEEIPRFVNTTKSVGRKHFCTFATYLAERRWEALPRRLEPVQRPTSCDAPKPIKSGPTTFQRANPHLYPELFGGKEAEKARHG
jgi:hypothetical protein